MRLAAILAADVVGYSRLIGTDEEGTLARINDLRRHSGNQRLLNIVAVLSVDRRWRLDDIASVVGAARCASEIQSGMDERNGTKSTDKRIELRIGIHVGDIIIDSATFLVMASTSLHGWKGSRIQAVSVSLVLLTNKLKVSSTSCLRTAASKS